MLWSDSIQYLLNVADDMEFIEVGPGDVLTKLIVKIKDQLSRLAGKAAAVKSAAVLAVADGKSASSAEEKAAAWNKRHPVGTKVKSLVMDYGDLVTRTPAIVLFGHRAAVYVQRYNGYFDLDEIAAA